MTENSVYIRRHHKRSTIMCKILTGRSHWNPVSNCTFEKSKKAESVEYFRCSWLRMSGVNWPQTKPWTWYLSFSKIHTRAGFFLHEPPSVQCAAVAQTKRNKNHCIFKYFWVNQSLFTVELGDMFTHWKIFSRFPFLFGLWFHFLRFSSFVAAFTIVVA